MIDEETEPSLCLCPQCRRNVDEMATQCDSCGAYFSAMGDRRKLNTHPFLGPRAEDIYRVCMAIVAILFVCALLALSAKLLSELAS